jgi:hypothetical protein
MHQDFYSDSVAWCKLLQQYSAAQVGVLRKCLAELLIRPVIANLEIRFAALMVRLRHYWESQLAGHYL